MRWSARAFRVEPEPTRWRVWCRGAIAHCHDVAGTPRAPTPLVAERHQCRPRRVALPEDGAVSGLATCSPQPGSRRDSACLRRRSATAAAMGPLHLCKLPAILLTGPLIHSSSKSIASPQPSTFSARHREDAFHRRSPCPNITRKHLPENGREARTDFAPTIAGGAHDIKEHRRVQVS
jgi:hypothetical protein